MLQIAPLTRYKLIDLSISTVKANLDFECSRLSAYAATSQLADTPQIWFECQGRTDSLVLPETDRE